MLSDRSIYNKSTKIKNLHLCAGMALSGIKKPLSVN